MTKVKLNDVADNLKAMGFKAEAKTFTRQTGEVGETVDIFGFTHCRISIDYSHDADPELKIFVDLKDGYAYPERDERGNVLRDAKGKVKRGPALSPAELKRYKAQTYARARAAVAGPAAVAHLVALQGGDLQALAKGFGLTKHERGQDNAATNEGGDPTEGAFDPEDEQPGPVTAAAAVTAQSARPATF